MCFELEVVVKIDNYFFFFYPFASILSSPIGKFSLKLVNIKNGTSQDHQLPLTKNKSGPTVSVTLKCDFIGDVTQDGASSDEVSDSVEEYSSTPSSTSRRGTLADGKNDTMRNDTREILVTHSCDVVVIIINRHSS
jgi:hypothetical protein